MMHNANPKPSMGPAQKLPPKDVTPPPPKAMPAEQQPLAKREERPIRRVTREIVVVERRRRKKQEKQHGVGYAIGMGVTIFAVASLFLGGAWMVLKRKKTPPPEPSEPIVEVRYLPAPAPPPPKVEPPPVLVAEAPKPPPLPPQPPEPPPSPLTALWRSPDSKATLRVSVGKDGVKGFYSPPNWMYAPGDLERGEVKGNLFTCSVVLGTRRFGIRAEREGDVLHVFKWVDPDGLRDEYRLVEVAFARGQINVAQALQLRQQIQAAMKTAGPEHAKDLGVWVREDAPKMVSQPGRRGR